MMSNTEVRPVGNMFALITNLIVHHSTLDILNQARELVCICDVVEKAFNPPLVFQWLKFSQNPSQFPGDP